MIAPVPISGMDPFLGAITQSISDKTIDDLWNSGDIQRKDDVMRFAYGTYTSDQPAISGNTNNTVVNSNEPVAVDAFNDYAENEPNKVNPVTGGIVDGSDVDTLDYCIKQNQDNSLEAVRPVAVTIPQASAALAQALGVSINYNEMSDELKDKFIDALYDASAEFLNETGGITAFMDANGNVFFPKSTLEAIQALLDEEGIGGDGSFHVTDLPSGVPAGTSMISFVGGDDFTFTRPGRYYRSCTNPSVFWAAYRTSSGSFYIVRFSKNTFKYAESAGSSQPSPPTPTSNATHGTSYGYSYYYSSFSLQSEYSGGMPVPVNDATIGQAEMVAALYGTVQGSGNFPEGTQDSQATHYTASNYPVAGVIAAERGAIEEIVRINLPATPDTTESTLDPNSDTDPNVRDKVPPAPIPGEVPDTNVSNPDVPLVDSSVVNSTLINELVEELANTLDPQPGQSSGVIPIPYMPGIVTPGSPPQYPSIVPASGPGLIHVYNPTPGEFVSFGNWLWVTYADATIDKIWSNPFDGIIGAFELYCTPSNDGTDNIRSGFLTCPTTAALVRQRYIEIDCGTVIVPEFYGNYLDYSPYSQAYIYLPFIGINEVSIDDIVGHAVNIRYRVDCYNGSCIAMIFIAKANYQNLCYQFAGNCAVEVPLAGGSQAAIKAGMMQAEAYARAQVASAAISAAQQVGTGIASGTVPGIVMGGLGGLGTAAAGMYGANQMVEAARVANKSSVQHSGQFGSSHGAMGMKNPFIIIRNPIQVKVVNYNDDYGFPAHKRVIVGGCTGYLRVREVNVISAHATDAEKAAIEAMLKNGVYVS